MNQPDPTAPDPLSADDSAAELGVGSPDSAVVEFCGERYLVEPGSQLTVGRDADLIIDDNPFLHRIFLVISHSFGHWFIHNVGGQLGATLSDPGGQFEAFLAPGSSLPLAFSRTAVVFSAGPTTYEFDIEAPGHAYSAPVIAPAPAGEVTAGPVRLTTDQQMMILALAEPRLRRDGRMAINLPSSPEAARRLGWSNSKFNRKLDNVCDKLSRLGVQGLRGDIASYASNRRARLVEYAVATRLVTADDLPAFERYVADVQERT